MEIQRIEPLPMSEWFFTKGGQQQGPVGFDELVRMARSGSLDAEKDMVWTSGMNDWKPAGTVDGLFGPPATQDAPAPDPSNPYAAPASEWQEPATDDDGALAEIAPGSEPIDVLACVKRGFEIAKRHFGIILLAIITYIVVYVVASLIFGAMDSALGFAPAQQGEFQIGEDGQMTGEFPMRSGPIEGILSSVLSIFLSLGFVRIGLNLVSGRETSVAMLFGEGRKLLPAIGASILFGIMMFVGFLLLIVPGIYLMLRYGQFMNAIVDRNLGVIDSLKYSSSITTGNRLNLFLLMLLSIAILIAGFVALVVGLIFAYPVIWMSWVVAYRWMQYGNRVTQDHPGTTTPLLSRV